MAIDQSKAVVLVLLDLPAAFDTVDHGVLFSRLEQMFGLVGKVFEWFRSYLKERSQRLSIQDAFSDVLCLFFSVPQGSVIDPLIFTIYTRSLGIIARRHGVGYHFYADDAQLYVSLDLGNESNCS